jgi:ribokinase
VLACVKIFGVIVVVGSINMDLVVRVERQVRPGETLLGSDYETHPGGKGANQAVAAARAGGKVRMVGRVGEDAFGGILLDGLGAEGIDLEHVRALSGPTGVAFISVDARGQNSIIVAPGANRRLKPEDLEPSAFTGAKAVLLQLEIPLETALVAAKLGREAGAKVILNLSPARPLSEAELEDIDLLLVNETEASALLEMDEGAIAEQPEEAAGKLTALASRVVLTLGERGAVWATPEESGHKSAFAVTVADTTAAGDAFAGALAVALTSGYSLAEATRWANAAGALAASRPGAQPSLPYQGEIDALCK